MAVSEYYLSLANYFVGLEGSNYYLQVSKFRLFLLHDMILKNLSDVHCSGNLPPKDFHSHEINWQSLRWMVILSLLCAGLDAEVPR